VARQGPHCGNLAALPPNLSAIGTKPRAKSTQIAMFERAWKLLPGLAAQLADYSPRTL
jgi:hypothetical protein